MNHGYVVRSRISLLCSRGPRCLVVKVDHQKLLLYKDSEISAQKLYGSERQH